MTKTSRHLMQSGSRTALTLAAFLAIGAGEAMAQTPPAAPTTPATTTEDDAGDEGLIVVTGYRAALRSALDTKRRANDVVDEINAEDIADFPDANLAESLQRLPGVSIDRDNGEGRTITVRGLGADFTRVRLNGLEALSTSGANDSGTTPNRSRGFDFNVFASELFSSLKVRKTASAEVDEGSLGATVDLVTGRPFMYKERKLALSVQDSYYENGGSHQPKFAGLFTDTFETGLGKMGFTVSGSYSKVDRVTDSYSRQAAAFDLAYSRPFFTPTLTAASPVGGIPEREGFAAPSTAVCNGGTVTAPVLNGVIPGLNITRVDACNTQRGSDPAAYALLYPNGGALRAFQGGTTVQTTAGSTVITPTLPTLNQQQLEQERTGFTAAFQWEPVESTRITFDAVYSNFENKSDFYQISTIGLNRFNNTGNTYNTATTGSAGLYTSCATTGSGVSGIACQGSEGTGAVLPGFANSTNPYNLNAFDYYNNPASVGYIPTSNNLALIDALVGKPSTRVLEAGVTQAGGTTVADYLKLGNIDFRASDDGNTYTTEFQQYSTSIEHDLTNRLKLSFVGGYSSSINDSLGLLSDFIRLDSGQGTPGNDYFIYDERGGGKMPVLNFGFDAANPANWDTVKGYSVLRVQARHTVNTYAAARTDIDWNAFDEDHIKFGLSRREFGFKTSELRRFSQEAISPTVKEGGTTIANVGRLINWGSGLDVPAGTTTSFWVPDNQKMADVFGFDCNCVNKYGDFRLVPGGASNNFGLNYKIEEVDTGGYVQYDWDRDLLGMRVRGNAGLRYALTEVSANGLTPTGLPITNTHEYEDWLPAMNAVFELREDMLLRFGAAKVMSRPQLSQLAPGITTFTVPTTVNAVTGGVIASGNTKLAPFRATNLDLALEWYFDKGALFGIALFNKDVDTFPQRVLAEGRLSDILDAGAIQTLRGSFGVGAGGDAQRAYIDGDNPFSISQPRDAPGGYIRGIEINYQQDFTFLPGLLRYLGAQVNYTHIESELEYIIDVGTATRPAEIGKAPFLGASPDSVNATLYYETPVWSTRVSTAYRSEYFTAYPIVSGSCAPGFCQTPLINDFVGSEATFNVDASASYKVRDNLTLTFEALNLTEQGSERFAYQDNPIITQYANPGRSFFFGVRASF